MKLVIYKIAVSIVTMFESIKDFVRNNSGKLAILAIAGVVTFLITGNVHDVFAPHRGR
jgi:hypothetical protein